MSLFRRGASHEQPLPSLSEGTIDFVLRSAEAALGLPVQELTRPPAETVAASLLHKNDTNTT